MARDATFEELMMIWPENVVLFIGGPWHAQFRRIHESHATLINDGSGFKTIPQDKLPSVLRVRGVDPHHRLCPPEPRLRPCLELQEIEALTGRSNHRQPGPIREDFEREQLLIHDYELHRCQLNDGRLRWLYVDSGLTQVEAERLAVRVIEEAL
jgi:hypothetical protein